MRSIPDIVEALGGSTAVAAAIELPMTTVASWKARGYIPAEYWAGLLDLARARKRADITLKVLADLMAEARDDRARRRRRPRAA